MNLLSSEPNRFIFQFINIPISINKTNYNNLTFIFRILTPEELERVLLVQGTSDIINVEIEEEVFESCLEGIIGLDERIIDLDNTEAGVVSTISGIIVILSRMYINSELQKSIDKERAQATVMDQIELLICYFYNTPIETVKKMPINEQFRKVSVIQDLSKILNGSDIQFGKPEE